MCEAIVPYYDEFGQNCTCVILRDGSKVEFKMPIRTYVRQLFYALHINLAARTQWITSILNKESGNPLLVNDEMVWIPVKFRKGVGSKDGCSGYVLKSAIKEVGDYTLVLACQQRLTTLSKANYIKDKQKDGQHLLYAYRDYYNLEP